MGGMRMVNEAIKREASCFKTCTLNAEDIRNWSNHWKRYEPWTMDMLTLVM